MKNCDFIRDRVRGSIIYLPKNLIELFRKVALMEDSDQNIHLKNLSTHPASNEEDALNLLFLGDTNRMIAEVIRV